MAKKRDSKQSGFCFGDLELFGAEIAGVASAPVIEPTSSCPGGCDCCEFEHAAFHEGVIAGERGLDEEACPYQTNHLSEAWLSGYSVGEMNQEAK